MGDRTSTPYRSDGKTSRSSPKIFAGACILAVFVAISEYRSSIGNLSCAFDQEGPTVVETTRWSTAVASKHSFGFFDDIPDSTWERMRRKALSFEQYANPADPNQGWEKPWRWYLDNLQPEFTCPHVIRVGGGHGDGPKWVCDPHRLMKKDCLVYSFGSKGQYDFEDGLIDIVGQHCEIHVFDFGSFDRTENSERNIHYHQWGLGSSYDRQYNDAFINGEEILSFSEIQDKLKHKGRTIDLLKIDCERCEWANYKDWVGVDARQILIEIHGIPSPVKATKSYRLPMNATDFFDALTEQSFVTFNKEVNVHDRECYEFSFLKLDEPFWADRLTPISD
jgi:hypothetical protein